MESLVSVIVPVYKVEKYLRRCIDSILNQTFTGFNLILVDDGSPDNCGLICDEYAEKDNRIHVIHKKNGGLSDARNAGLDWYFEHSDSKWLTFIDSDDWIHPRYLEGLLEAERIYSTDIVVCDYLDAEEYKTFQDINKFNIININVEDFFIKHNTIATVAWGKIYKKRFFEGTRYPVGKLNEDEFITYKLLFQNINISFVKNQMYFYYKNIDGIMRSFWKPKKMDALEALNEQYIFFRKSKYDNAFSFVVNKYIWFLRENFNNLQNYKDFDTKDNAIKNIRKSLKKCLRQHCVDKSNFRNEELYKIAYPHLAKVLHLKKRIKKKYYRIISKLE